VALTPKQAAFVREYLVDLNATQAAIRAGYSASSAEVTGSKLLGNPKVRQAVDEAVQRRSERVEVKQDDVLLTLLRILNADIGKAFDADGRLLAMRDIPPDVRLAISAVETDELYGSEGGKRTEIGLTRKLKFWSKDKALELAMRHLGLLKDRVDVKVSMTLEDLVQLSMKKPEDG